MSVTITTAVPLVLLVAAFSLLVTIASSGVAVLLRVLLVVMTTPVAALKIILSATLELERVSGYDQDLLIFSICLHFKLNLLLGIILDFGG